MEIQINDKIMFKSIKSKKELQQNILDLITETKIEKVVYHGLSSEIDFRTIKRILLTKEQKKNKIKNNSSYFKEKYAEILANIEEDFCIIYKK